jgi:hypothetical protein
MNGPVPTIDAERDTKARRGPAAGGLAVADPRPQVDGDCVLGLRCTKCGYPTAQAAPRCPVCFGELGPARFGPGGTVFSSTVIHLPSGGRQWPFGLAYVDLDDGPRILVHADAAAVPGVGDRVRIAGTLDGDVLVERG